MQKLTIENVQAILKSCLYRDDEISQDKPPDGAIIADGVLHKFALHPERTAAAKSAIDALLMELPDEFQKSKGGGWSFLNACMDKHGRHWGEHRNIEELVCLGIAVKSAAWLMKDMMEIMPGGLPYFVVDPSPTSALSEPDRS